MGKAVLIPGITGQDGAYLVELLLGKGYIVHGVKRRSSSFNSRRIDELALAEVGRKIEWKGTGIDAGGLDAATCKTRIKIDPRYFHPAEVDLLRGDPSKAQRVLGGKHKMTFPELVAEMVKSYLKVIVKKLHVRGVSHG